MRPLTWEKRHGHPLNRRLYLPEYCLNTHDPSFGREMDLPLIMAALMNRWGEDILPEEVAYIMEDMATSSTANAAFAAAAGCCGYPCWQAWMDLADLRAQIHDGCSVAVQVERRIRGQRDPARVWMGLRGFGHDDAVMADYVLLNDPTADTDGAVNCTMALVDFMRYFTGRAIALRAKPRDLAANRPLRMRCELVPGETAGRLFFEQRGGEDPLPEVFPAGSACAPHDGVAHATTAHRSFVRMERTEDGGIRFPEKLAAGGRFSVYAVDQTGRMRVAEVRLPKPRPASTGATCFTPTGKAGTDRPAPKAFFGIETTTWEEHIMAKTIITLGREYCTGGRFIAEDVANALGIKLYDKELITMAAKHSGLSEEAVAASEKRHTHSLLYSLYTMGNELPLGDQVFILQSRIIKQLAEEGPCVILGRCGDYVLRERPNVLRVFVYAPKEWRLEYAKTNPLVKAKDAKGIKEEVEKTDRNRAAYYNYYTQNRWGDAHNYDLAINAALGRETCVKMILDAVAAKEKTMAE